MKAELVTIPTEITDASIKQYLADCSSVVRIKQPKDNDRLFDRLLKESYGGKASRVFEYVPCTVYVGDVPDMVQYSAEQEPHQYFGWFLRENYFTNARELFNWGWTWEEILEVVDFTHYRTVRVTAPYFIYGQLSTHTQVTSVSHSARYTESNLGYWKPLEIPATKEAWDDMVETMSPKGLEAFMKGCGVNRREVFARGKDMLQYRVYTLGGYLNNPNAFPHFINQRMRDAHTQLETRQVTELIAKELGI